MVRNIFVFSALVLLLTVAGPEKSYSQSPTCKSSPMSVTSNSSGRILNSVSMQEIVRSTISKLRRKWIKIAKKKYGRDYKFVDRGVCVCTLKPKKQEIGDLLRVKCKITARACTVNQFFVYPFRCKIE